MATIQVWSAPSCQSGAICYGALAPWVSASGSEATGTPSGFRVSVSRAVATRASLQEGRCLRVLSTARGEQWFYVSQVSDSDGQDSETVTATCGPLRQLLTVRGLIRDGSTFRFTPGKRTVASLITTYALTNLSTDGLSWLSLGTTSDFPDTYDVGTLDRSNRAGLLGAIEQETGGTAVLRALYSGSTLTGFAIDLVADVSYGAPNLLWSVGAQVTQLQRTRDALRASTVTVPFSASAAPMEQTDWTVLSTSGTAPAWILLRDPISGNPWPILEDGQIIGAYLQQDDGTQSQILDSRAVDSAVQVASVGSLVAGSRVTVVTDTSGSPVLELTSPSGVAGSRGRLVATVGTKVTDVRRNIAPNGALQTWTDDTTITGWTQQNSANPPQRYPLTTTQTYTGLTFAVAMGPSDTSVQIGGFPAGARIYRNENFSYSIVVGGASWVYTANGSGVATLPLQSATGFTVGAGASVTHSSGVAPARPNASAFPSEGLTNAARVWQSTGGTLVSGLGTAARLQSPSFRVLYRAAVPYLRAAMGVTTVTGSTSGTISNLDGSSNPTDNLSLAATLRLPFLLLRNNGSGTMLSWSAVAQSITAGTTRNDVVTTSASISADFTASVGFYAPDLNAVGYVRWISVWLDARATTDPMGPTLASGSNLLWHRAQDVLASQGAGTRYTVRGIDLQRLIAETGVPVLGQTVRLRSSALALDDTVTIQKLDYVFGTQNEVLSAEVGVLTPRLTGVTVSL